MSTWKIKTAKGLTISDPWVRGWRMPLLWVRRVWLFRGPWIHWDLGASRIPSLVSGAWPLGTQRTQGDWAGCFPSDQLSLIHSSLAIGGSITCVPDSGQWAYPWRSPRGDRHVWALPLCRRLRCGHMVIAQNPCGCLWARQSSGAQVSNSSWREDREDKCYLLGSLENPEPQMHFKRGISSWCREKGTLLRHWWKCNLVHPLRRKVWRVIRKLKIELPCDSVIPLLDIYPHKTTIKKDACTFMFIPRVFTIVKT